MVHDTDAKQLVIGKTREQLERKFGGPLLGLNTHEGMLRHLPRRFRQHRQRQFR